MPLSGTDFVLGVALPMLAAGVLFALLNWCVPQVYATRCAASLALVVGFCAGYFAIPLGPWTPQTHWHWLPYSALVAAVPCCVFQSRTSFRMTRTIAQFGVAFGIGWFLVPDWEHFQPWRTIYLLAWPLIVSLVTISLEPVCARCPSCLLGVVLTTTLVGAAVILGFSGSLRFAQMAGGAASAMVGIHLASIWRREPVCLSTSAYALSVICCGSLLVGYVNSFSSIPLLSCVLIPLAPLMLWTGLRGPLTRLAAGRRWAAATSLAFALLLTAILLGVTATR